MRSETKEVHSQVEGAKIVGQIIGKTIKKDDYCKLLARYYHMYATLEEEFEKNKTNSAVANVYFPEILRLNSIESDLTFFLGDKWTTLEVIVEAKEATKDFCSHIRKVSKESPELLVAHLYVRYLGDLAGGQMIGNKLRGCFTNETLPDKNGDPDAGVKFYVFDNVPNIKDFVLKFKAGLDSISNEGDLHEKLIDEAIVCFELNGDILSQV